MPPVTITPPAVVAIGAAVPITLAIHLGVVLQKTV
jgi:hypothetical protein